VRGDAQTMESRRLSGLIDKAERSSAPLASKIGAGSGIGRDSGGDTGELKLVQTQSCPGNIDLSHFQIDIYDEVLSFMHSRAAGYLPASLVDASLFN